MSVHPYVLEVSLALFRKRLTNGLHWHSHASKRRVSFPTVNNVTGEGSDERGPVRGSSLIM
jgi:hypothetical protein